MSASSMADTLSALNRDYLQPMAPGGTIGRFLEASLDPDSRAPRLASIIEGNPLYSHSLQKLDILQDQIRKWREESPEDRETGRLTRYIVVLLGPVLTLDAMLAIWLERHSPQGLPRKPQAAPHVLTPRARLRYALLAREYCEGNDLPDPRLAYLAGLAYDRISLLIDCRAGAARSERNYLEETWNEAIRASRIAHELAAIPTHLLLSRHAFAACLLAYLGKVLMALSFPGSAGGPGWKDFLRHCASHGAMAETAWSLLEPRAFAFTHSEAAALCALRMPWLAPAAGAIRFHREPYLLRSSDPEGFGLGAVLCAAVTLAAARPLSPRQREWLASEGIPEEALPRALARASGKASQKGEAI